MKPEFTIPPEQTAKLAAAIAEILQSLAEQVAAKIDRGDKIMTLSEASAYLNRPRTVLKAAVKSRSIPYMPFRRTYSFRKRDLDRFIDQTRIEPKPQL